MPRGVRRDAPRSVHHVLVRGIERRRIFHDNRDRVDFLDRLARILPESGMRCFGWSLIPNHVHLVIQTGQVPLPQVMARLNTGYAQAFNLRHRRAGHLFQNRYKSIAVEGDSHLLTLIRYVHLNPVRARLLPSTDELATYPWTGHAALMGFRPVPFQDTESVLQHFSPNIAEARIRLANWMRECHDEENRGPRRAALDPESEHTRVRALLGVAESSETLAGRAPQTTPSTAPPVSPRELPNPGPADLEHLIDEVTARYGVSLEELRSPARTRSVSRARAVIAYLACRRLGISGALVARTLGLSKGAITQACARGAILIAENPSNRHDPHRPTQPRSHTTLPTGKLNC